MVPSSFLRRPSLLLPLTRELQFGHGGGKNHGCDHDHGEHNHGDHEQEPKDQFDRQAYQLVRKPKSVLSPHSHAHCGHDHGGHECGHDHGASEAGHAREHAPSPFQESPQVLAIRAENAKKQAETLAPVKVSLAKLPLGLGQVYAQDGQAGGPKVYLYDNRCYRYNEQGQKEIYPPSVVVRPKTEWERQRTLLAMRFSPDFKVSGVSFFRTITHRASGLRVDVESPPPKPGHHHHH